jgi:hypothetical protein
MKRVLLLVVAACASAPPPQRPAYQPAAAAERSLPATSARLVSIDEATRSGLTQQLLVIPFTGGRDGTELVTEYFKQADAAHAELIANLAIYIPAEHDGQFVECRSEVVPETVVATRWQPAEHRVVNLQKPVTESVTEQQYRCGMVSASENRTYTEYQQQCGSVSRPVSRTRTVYTYQYDYASHSSRSVPHTEYYTEYESHYECKSVPVTRSRLETVMKNECHYAPVTHQVTRYEYQLQSQYIPAHFETFTRQRLRELEPVCYVAPELSRSAAGEKHIDGLIFVRRR